MSRRVLCFDFGASGGRAMLAEYDEKKSGSLKFTASKTAEFLSTELFTGTFSPCSGKYARDLSRQTGPADLKVLASTHGALTMELSTKTDFS